jgi:hypothetical protein
MSGFPGLCALVVTIAVASMSRPVLAQTDSAAWTWKLNVAKSKYDPGPAPKGSTVTIAVVGEAVKVSTRGLDADGKPTGTQYTARLDGKDYPVKLTGPQDYDTVAFKRIDASTVEGTRKKAGSVVQTYTRVVSADGKTLTITTAGTNAKGQKVNNVAVYDKQ